MFTNKILMSISTAIATIIAPMQAASAQYGGKTCVSGVVLNPGAGNRTFIGEFDSPPGGMAAGNRTIAPGRIGIHVENSPVAQQRCFVDLQVSTSPVQGYEFIGGWGTLINGTPTQVSLYGKRMQVNASGMTPVITSLSLGAVGNPGMMPQITQGQNVIFQWEVGPNGASTPNGGGGRYAALFTKSGPIGMTAPANSFGQNSNTNSGGWGQPTTSLQQGSGWGQSASPSQQAGWGQQASTSGQSSGWNQGATQQSGFANNTAAPTQPAPQQSTKNKNDGATTAAVLGALGGLFAGALIGGSGNNSKKGNVQNNISGQQNNSGGQNVGSTAVSSYPLALKQPTTFSRGTRFTSPSHYVELQTDGNLVVKTTGGGYIFGMNQLLPNDYQRIARMEFQADGNLAAYDANGQWVWSALSQTNKGGQLVLDDIGQLQLLNAQNKVLWVFSPTGSPANLMSPQNLGKQNNQRGGGRQPIP